MKDAPSKIEVMEKLQALISATVTREAAANWAQRWVILEYPPDMDEEVWSALVFICSADMISLDRPYLYGREDFERELERLK